MKIGFYLNFFILTLVVKVITANVRLVRSQPQQYCGSKLADIMKVICKSKYYGKRSQMEMEVLDYKDLAQDYNDVDYPYRTKREAMSYTPYSRTKKSRIIDECCHKPCDINELRGYCAN